MTGTFPIYFVQILLFLHLETTLVFAKLCYAFEKKFQDSKKPYVQWKCFTQQNLRRKHTDQDSKNKEVIEGIPERDLQNFMLGYKSSGFYNMKIWKKIDIVNYSFTISFSKRKIIIYWLKLSNKVALKICQKAVFLNLITLTSKQRYEIFSF